jgi:phosphopantetheinyl transferase
MSKVYYSIIDVNTKHKAFSNLNCLERVKYVNSINDDKRKIQSYYAWKLLEYVVSDYQGLQFKLNADGKWIEITNLIKFSISHSENVVAVAISDEDIGVDVERCNEKTLIIKRRFNLEEEKDLSLVQNLTLSWTKEESKYKCGVDGRFESKKILIDNGNEFFITACFLDDAVSFEQINFENINNQ